MGRLQINERAWKWGEINVFCGRRLEQASADALPLTKASLIPGNQSSFSDGEERNDTQKSGFREK